MNVPKIVFDYLEYETAGKADLYIKRRTSHKGLGTAALLMNISELLGWLEQQVLAQSSIWPQCGAGPQDQKEQLHINLRSWSRTQGF